MIEQDQPDEMWCHQWSPNMKYSTDCQSRAKKLSRPPFVLDNQRGDWYGCPLCGRVGQFLDFVEGRHNGHKPKE